MTQTILNFYIVFKISCSFTYVRMNMKFLSIFNSTLYEQTNRLAGLLTPRNALCPRMIQFNFVVIYLFHYLLSSSNLQKMYCIGIPESRNEKIFRSLKYLQRNCSWLEKSCGDLFEFMRTQCFYATNL